MTNRTLKTIEAAAEAIFALPRPATASVHIYVSLSDDRKSGVWCRMQTYRASLWDDDAKLFDCAGPTPTDLYRNFAGALQRHFAPKRIGVVPPTALARRGAARAGDLRAADEHDHVRAGPRRVTATIVTRIEGPK